MRYRQWLIGLAEALMIFALVPAAVAEKTDRAVKGFGQSGMEQQMRKHVQMLAATIGERNLWHFAHLEQAAAYIDEQLQAIGYEPHSETYDVQGKTCRNIVVEKTGSVKPEEIVLIGAHYDSVLGSPGANDNGSGVAALLEMARMLAEEETARTLRLVAFVNEEPPFFQTEQMGSRVHARRSRERDDDIVVMISLETIGYYRDEEGSQAFPSLLLRPFYPGTGNFIAFVGNVGSRRSVDRAIDAFRRHSDFPAEALVAPGWLAGVEWSDQWSFWQEGYPAFMITDTAPFRYPHYHAPGDTPDKLDYPSLTRLTEGLAAMVRTLVR